MLADLLKSPVLRWARRGRLVAPALVASPTTPVDGELWTDSTLSATRQLRAYSGGVVRSIEIRAEKDVASGYAGLDAGGRLTAAPGVAGAAVIRMIASYRV